MREDMVRKEGIIFLVIVISVFFVMTQGTAVLNALIIFLLAGVVPGTQIAFSSSSMFVLMCLSLCFLMMWVYRHAITLNSYENTPQAGVAKSVSRRRFKQIRS